MTTRPSLLALTILIGAPLIGLISFWNTPSPKGGIVYGEWQLAYEKAFDEKLTIREASINTWGVITYALFHEGRHGVLAGTDGWLYTSEDFEAHKNADAETQRKLELIRTIRKFLESRNIYLSVLLIPDKSRIYPEHLGQYQRPSYVEKRYENFRRQLLSLGILTPDLNTTFAQRKGQQQLFLKTDTHWTAAGAALAAEQLAESLPPGMPGRNSGSFGDKPDGTAEHKGDLLKFLPLGTLGPALGVAYDQLDLRESTDNSASGLLDEVTVPGVLVGSSYSADERWHFVGALQNTLQAGISNFAQDGKGPFVPMLEYLRSADFTKSPPQFIIWEIPERFIEVKYELPDGEFK